MSVTNKNVFLLSACLLCLALNEGCWMVLKNLLGPLVAKLQLMALLYRRVTTSVL